MGGQRVAEVTFLRAHALEDPETVMNEAIWRDQCPSIILCSAKQMGYPFSRENMKSNPENPLFALFTWKLCILFSQSCSIGYNGKIKNFSNVGMWS